MKSIIGQRYAKALYKLKKSDIIETHKQLLPLLDLFEDQKIKKVIANPAVSNSLKSEIMEAAANQLSLDVTIKNFLKVVVNEGRLTFLPDIITSVEEIAHSENQAEKAELITAVDINDEDTQKIKIQIEKQLSKKLTISKKVDPEILGGFIMNIGQTRIDQSVRKSLRNIVHSVSSDV